MRKNGTFSAEGTVNIWEQSHSGLFSNVLNSDGELFRSFKP